MWDRTLHALAHRGVTREGYLQLVGRSEEDVLAELREEAAVSLRREAVVTAIVDAEKIAPSEQQLADALTQASDQEGVTPAALVERLRDSGRLQEALDDLAARMAIDLICDEATPITPAQAEVRERIWTPEEREGDDGGNKSGELWTPDR